MAINHPTQHKRSSVAGNVPAAGVLNPGELGINFADKSLYTKDAGGNVIELARDIFILAAAPASPVKGDVWYDTGTEEIKSWNGSKWTNISFTGKDVTPANTTSTAGFGSGTGTSGDPYIVTTTTVTSGESQVVDTITVTGLNPGQFVPIVDQAATGKFSFSNFIADSSGTLVFSVFFDDSPSSVAGTNHTCNIQIGTATVYATEQVSIVAATASFPQSVSAPDSLNSKATTWTAANDTLTASGCLTISTDNVTFSQGPLAVNSGDTLYTKWSGTAGSGNCIDQADGTTLSETLTAADSSTATLTMVIDKTPAAFTWTDDTGVATSSVTASNTVTVAGINSYAYISGSTTGSTLEYSKNGGAWTAVPASDTATDYVVSGDNIQVRHTNSATASTTYDATVNIGLSSDIYSSTTSAVTPSVATPTINTPVDGATGIATTVAITADAYNPLNGAGPHTSTDWEIYSDAGLTPANLVDSSLADTTNLTSWSPAGLAASTQYWVRVKYRSSDPVESSWSSVIDFTTNFNGWLFEAGVEQPTSTYTGIGWHSASGGGAGVAQSPTITSVANTHFPIAAAAGTLLVGAGNASDYSLGLLVSGYDSGTNTDSFSTTLGRGDGGDPLDPAGWNLPVASVSGIRSTLASPIIVTLRLYDYATGGLNYDHTFTVTLTEAMGGELTGITDPSMAANKLTAGTVYHLEYISGLPT